MTLMRVPRWCGKSARAQPEWDGRQWDATWVAFAKVAAAGRARFAPHDAGQGSQLEWSSMPAIAFCRAGLSFSSNPSGTGGLVAWVGNILVTCLASATRPSSVAGPFQNQQHTWASILLQPGTHSPKVQCRLCLEPQTLSSPHGRETMSFRFFDRTPRRRALRSRRRRACNELVVPIPLGRPARAC